MSNRRGIRTKKTAKKKDKSLPKPWVNGCEPWLSNAGPASNSQVPFISLNNSQPEILMREELLPFELCNQSLPSTLNLLSSEHRVPLQHASQNELPPEIWCEQTMFHQPPVQDNYTSARNATLHLQNRASLLPTPSRSNSFNRAPLLPTPNRSNSFSRAPLLSSPSVSNSFDRIPLPSTSNSSTDPKMQGTDPKMQTSFRKVEINSHGKLQIHIERSEEEEDVQFLYSVDNKKGKILAFVDLTMDSQAPEKRNSHTSMHSINEANTSRFGEYCDTSPISFKRRETSYVAGRRNRLGTTLQ